MLQYDVLSETLANVSRGPLQYCQGWSDLMPSGQGQQAVGSNLVKNSSVLFYQRVANISATVGSLIEDCPKSPVMIQEVLTTIC